MNKAIDFLKKHESISPSYFEENAKWRKENKVWLEWSRSIALSLVDYMGLQWIEQKWFGRAFGCFSTVYQ